MRDLLELIEFDTSLFWGILAITIVLVASIPKFFKLRFVNGLLAAQITFVLNAVPIISGLSNEVLPVVRGIHFYIIEFSYLVLIYAVYAQLIERRVFILAALDRFFNSRAAPLLMALTVLISVFEYLVAPSDGGSRIEHMTTEWYTVVRPIVIFAIPLAYIGVFILRLNRKRRTMGFLMLLAIIAGSIFSGSKAGFVFGLIFAFLALRDLSPSSINLIRNGDKFKLSVLVGVMLFVALSRLDLTAQAFIERIFLTGDATLMTYFSERPTAACEGVSTFASMHRGFARLAGDPSANNIDTLFGFALMIDAVGVNSFTGPNARLSPYALCNFPDARILFLVICILVYLGLLFAVFRRVLSRPLLLAVVYPFMQASLYNSSQDFHLVMQGITIFILLLSFTFIFSLKTGRKIG